MKVLLVANYIKTPAYQAMQAAAHWLAEGGYGLHQLTSDQLRIDGTLYNEIRATIGDYDLVVTFGGDGTILRTVQVIGTSEVPLLGVNFGELGFLTGASSEDPLAALKAALCDGAAAERRFLLSAKVHFASGRERELTALNEIVLGRSDLGRDITLGMAINDCRLPDVRGDGIIVATASGSTGYALAAGGPVLAPAAKGLILVPLTAHSLALRPIVTGDTDRIELNYRERFAQTVVVTLDGQVIAVPGGDDYVTRVEVGPADGHLVLLRCDAPDFYARLSSAFFGGGSC
jgi:NAD+ kinase